MKPLTLRPNKTAFLLFPILRKTIAYPLIAGVLIYILSVIPWAQKNLAMNAIIILFSLSYIIGIITRFYNYKKERYILGPDRFVHKSGGIFSDEKTELNVRNITHVTMLLPFIENSLFKTGSISIQSAGAASAEVYLRSIDKPGDLYLWVEKTMKKAGFKLTKNKLVQKERPAVLGVFFETFKGVIGLIFLFIYIAGIAFTLTQALTEQGINPSFLFGLVGIAFIYFLFNRVLTFMDLKLRVYKIYNDSITYKEGFLSKNYAFMPVENLSDAATTQTLVDRIFGLHDIKVSCQGTSHEIIFKNISHGEKMEKNIDHLIGRSKTLIGAGKFRETDAAQKKEAKKVGQPYRSHLKAERSFKASFQMKMSRALVPMWILLPFFLILFPFIWVWAILLISTIIAVNATRYFIRPQGMEMRYKFINARSQEFTNDKIMAIMFYENFIDTWCNTFTAVFWSIGSASDLMFKHLEKVKGLKEKILAKKGLVKQEIIYKMGADFSFSSMLAAGFWAHIVILVIIAGLGVLSFIVNPLFILGTWIFVIFYIIWIIYAYFYYPRMKMVFYKDYVYFQKGIFFRKYFYVPYDNIKDIHTIKYPWSHKGAMMFNVAGERIVQQGKNTAIQSNAFRIDYVDNIETKDELIDLIFFKRPDAGHVRDIEKDVHKHSPKPILVEKQSIKNSVLGLLIGSVIFFPAIALLPITLPLTIWYVKKKAYWVQSYRVCASWGIVFRHQTSITYQKIDHINYDQGWMNKLFRNGNVSVNTTGSSSSEIVIKDIPDFKRFYEELKRHY